MKIGIFSSASFKVSSKNKKLAKSIAEYLKEKGVEVVTGGSLGIPGIIAEHAYNLGEKHLFILRTKMAKIITSDTTTTLLIFITIRNLFLVLLPEV